MLTISVILGLVALVFAIWKKQPLSKSFGIALNRWMSPDLGVGLLISMAAMVGIFLVELLIGSIQITGLPLEFSRSELYLNAFGAVFEEFIFRGLALSGLLALLGGRKWPAILISAVFFGAAHLNNPNASYLGAFGNALGGIMYGIAFLGSKNIWMSIGLHFNWNFIQGQVLGFPVSGTENVSLITQKAVGPELITGGAYGPEAGLVGITFRFVVMALILYYLKRQSGGQGEVKSLSYPRLSG